MGRSKGYVVRYEGEWREGGLEGGRSRRIGLVLLCSFCGSLVSICCLLFFPFDTQSCSHVSFLTRHSLLVTVLLSLVLLLMPSVLLFLCFSFRVLFFSSISSFLRSESELLELERQFAYVTSCPFSMANEREKANRSSAQNRGLETRRAAKTSSISDSVAGISTGFDFFYLVTDVQTGRKGKE